jgi:23S rRNA (guanosine2251-2'-O)-methyltransferase
MKRANEIYFRETHFSLVFSRLPSKRRPMNTMNEQDRPGALEYVAGRKPVREFLFSHPDKVEAVFLRKGLQGGDVQKIVTRCKEGDIKYKFASLEELDRMFPGNHQGLLLEIAAGEYAELDVLLDALAAAPLPVILALDQVQDPGNLGTLARTMYGLGGAGLLVPKHESAKLGVGAVRSSAGTLAKLPVCRATNLSNALEACRKHGVAVYGSGGEDGSVSVYGASFQFPCVLVLGNEDKGVRPGVAKRCDAILRIPLPRSLDSLNVAQAGAIILGQMSAVLASK